MEKSLKTIEAVEAYQLLGNAKYHKLEDADKIKVWKISRQLKPIAVQAEEAQQDAMQSLVPEEFKERVAVADDYRKAKQAGEKQLPMTDKEYLAYMADFRKYNMLVGKALEELFQKEASLDFEPLSEDAMGLLIACNDWPMSQAEKLEWMIG
jgi:hypothetical protein